MTRTHLTLFTGLLCAVLLSGLLCVAWVTPSLASDHNDGPSAANDQGIDIADLYAFMDPNDNSFLSLILTQRGFITPGEAENQATFQDNARFRIEIENTGDAAADLCIEVRFDDRQGFRTAQNATVELIDLGPGTRTNLFTAPDNGIGPITTIAVSDGPDPRPFEITTDTNSEVSFFAGQVDDPFFFDVSGELQFRDSLDAANRDAGMREQPGDPNVLLRGRDTFAGYNILAIALRVPLSLVQGSTNSLGISAFTDRLGEEAAVAERAGSGVPLEDDFFQVDRQGFPVLNVVLIRYPRKRDYNRSTPVDDANLMFASEIVDRLVELGTSDANINILANAAVLNGDQLRLDTTIPNIGPEGGTNPEAAFPNGRRLADNAPDTLVNIITNQSSSTLLWAAALAVVVAAMMTTMTMMMTMVVPRSAATSV